MRNILRWKALSTICEVSFLAALLILCSPSQSPAKQSAFNVLCRPELSLTHRHELADKLRAITGWRDLRFDEQGALRLGEGEYQGGSQTARDLLASAVSGKNVIVLEDASNRFDVVFCSVIKGRWRKETAASSPVYIILIDFADFSHLVGDKPALAAFDVGWGVMHEINHVVHDSTDAERAGETGECEGLINQMRRECGLAERADYYFTFLPGTYGSAFITRFVHMAFDQKNPDGSGKKRHWLMWDANLVGGLNNQRQLAFGR